MLAACGGGGGDARDSDGAGGGGATLSGRLWHNNYALDFVDGTQISSLAQTLPLLVTGNKTAIPWPDGSQYVTADWNVFDDNTVVTVRDTASGATLHTLNFRGYVRSLRPSPVSKSMLLATWGEDSVSPAYRIFVDLPGQQVLSMLPAGDGPIQWLPDGRYVKVSSSGWIEAGPVGGTTSLLGQLSLPAGKTLGNIDINPQGTQMTLRLMVFNNAGGMDESDIWVANLDGSGLGQLTNTKISSYGQWSPDGRYVAFDVDTGLVCGGGTCAGSCGLWYAPATSRNVLALDSSGDAFKFRIRNRSNSERVLGCELLGWTS